LQPQTTMPRTPQHSHLTTPKRIVGVVISNLMDRTCVVGLQRYYLHPLTNKVMRHLTKLFCHDQHELCGVGDRVQIKHFHARISKKKTHAVVDIVQRHPQLEGEPFPFSKLQRHPREHWAEEARLRGAAGTGLPLEEEGRLA
jgi:small subunit ribosomal protein S17